MKNSFLSTLFLAGGALAVEPSPVSGRPAQSTIEPSLVAVESAAVTAEPLSPVSSIKGAGFDRIVQIWLENQDFDTTADDPNMQWLAKQGITLNNYFATTHPSEPNYAAVVGGDNFGMDNDDFHAFPPNISTVADLLDYKGISWGEYQEGLPYVGFQGFNYSNQETFANDYVRKHNPLMLYESVTNNATRVSLIKNFTSFYDDLDNQKLPQWSFITPNMTNDAHDTNITFSAKWTRSFMEPLLNNSYFMDNTLVIITFDETGNYTVHNRVFTVLLGGAIDESLHGTVDNTFYNHYSTISTVSVNWGLPSLGRWDCDANVLEVVANKTGYQNAVVDTDNLYFNFSYPGPVSDDYFTPGWWPSPDTEAKCASGLGVLSSIVSTWGNSTGNFNYTNVYPYDQSAGINAAGTPTTGSSDANSTSNSTSSSASASQSASAAMPIRADILSALGLAGLVAAFL